MYRLVVYNTLRHQRKGDTFDSVGEVKLSVKFCIITRTIFNNMAREN